jgi:hypothetical protein
VKSMNRLVRFLGMVALGIAVYQELQKPAEERTWNGKVVDFVPYDLRPPTVERLKDRLWNPSDPRVLVPTLFGVGWTVNFGRVYHLLASQYRVESPQETA